jgi:hypothetical protein
MRIFICVKNELQESTGVENITTDHVSKSGQLLA